MYLYCAYSLEFINKYSEITDGIFPLKFGVAKDLRDRHDRMNYGWRMSKGRRGAQLGLCSGWKYGAPPMFETALNDERVKETSEHLFGKWEYCSVLRENMFNWQTINVPKTKFQSNGVGEICLVSTSRWAELSNEFKIQQFDEDRSLILIKKVALLSIKELTAKLGLKYVPLKDFKLE